MSIATWPSGRHHSRYIHAYDMLQPTGTTVHVSALNACMTTGTAHVSFCTEVPLSSELLQVKVTYNSFAFLSSNHNSCSPSHCHCKQSQAYLVPGLVPRLFTWMTRVINVYGASTCSCAFQQSSTASGSF